ncbi:cobaltochelatase CobN [Rhizobium azooxidifex]|uniref:Cobaltochelatase subunit CobN n=1 Tax=Mycoplana azooxidifex TaxID=1636188 RepID=A0A7W6GIS9_9HYPH|nr:cobaltochelatase subunit CobN [Mycoplana azooxidifex]MBB3975154.1 cobaltochelatase CobN [Mycoplana azooxidifex]
MHLLLAQKGTIADGKEAIDLGQSPGDVLFLSAADTELASIAAAHRGRQARMRLRLASLASLTHPMSVDTYVERTARHARLIVVRALGGASYFRYVLEALHATAVANDITIVALPGDDRPDEGLAPFNRIPDDDRLRLWAYLTEGGAENAARFLSYADALVFGGEKPEAAAPLEKAGIWWPGSGVVDVETWREVCPSPQPSPRERGEGVAQAADVSPSPRLRGEGARRADEGRVARSAPPSVLPDISPSRGEIGQGHGRRDMAAAVRGAVAGDELRGLLSDGSTNADAVPGQGLTPSISPLEREMSGRTEGGIFARDERGAADEGGVVAGEASEPPTVAICFYRAYVQSGETRPVELLIEALADVGVRALPIFVSSLKDPASIEIVRAAFAAVRPEVALNATSFAVSAPGANRRPTVLDETGAQVLQVIFSGSSREAWQASGQGLTARDLGMNVSLPEVDGRVLARAVSFKAAARWDAEVETNIVSLEPVADRIRFSARLAANWARLRRTGPGERRIALVMANYPNRDGRLGNGVGLDTPAGTLEILRKMKADGYAVADLPSGGDALIAHLMAGSTNAANDGREIRETISLKQYNRFFASLPGSIQEQVTARWGAPEADPFVTGDVFALPLCRFGGTLVGIQPARGYNIDPKETYHSQDLVPPHGYFAFYAYLREVCDVHAIVHVGKHGNLEWLPGKALALSEACYPEAVFGPVPHLYPFIVNDPGEGTQAKRRSAAVIIDHLTPPLTRAETYGPLKDLEALVDEFYDASGGDPRRLRLLSRQILDLVRDIGLDQDAGIARSDGEEAALQKLDAYLCDLKEMQIRDGLHVFGVSPSGRLLTDLTLALARVPRGLGEGGDASLQRAIAADALGGGSPVAVDIAATRDAPPSALPGISPSRGEIGTRRMAAVHTDGSGRGDADGADAAVDGHAGDGRGLAPSISPHEGEMSGRTEGGTPPHTAFDPLDCVSSDPWTGPMPDILASQTDVAWRTAGDTVERIELLAARLVSGELPCPDGWEATRAVLDQVRHSIRPSIEACGEAEMAALMRGLSGRFVEPGPSGAPTRGRPDVLPTGRNFYSVDSRAVPTPAAWELGRKSAELLVTRYAQDHGEWPTSFGITAWGTSNMRTGGDDIAQALALIGAKPVWDTVSRRVTGYEVIPPALLRRPRVDVTLRISGFFRDAFPEQIALFDRAVRAIGALDEDGEDNPIAARMRAEAAALAAHGATEGEARARAGYRVFGARPGSYGAGLQTMIDEGLWKDRGDLAEAWLAWGAHAYAGEGEDAASRDRLEARMKSLQAIIQNQDNREHDLLDSDEYYQFEGGMAAAVAHLTGSQPTVYHNDHSRPEKPVVRTLEDEIGRVVRARVVNPKWIEGMMRHGYKGAFELAATVDFMFAFAATTGAVKDHHFEAVYKAYILDERVRAFMAEKNPAALKEMSDRLVEAIDRRLWSPRSNSARFELGEIAGKRRAS